MENTIRTMKNTVKWKMDILKTVKWKKLFSKVKTVKLPPIAPLFLQHLIGLLFKKAANYKLPWEVNYLTLLHCKCAGKTKKP